VMREILDETIPNNGEDGSEVTESGRTLCGAGDVRGPLARFPTAVELASCPRGAKGGTWHTHVTKDQLRNPTNSLPDTANVIFDEMSVSAVVGTESVEMVIAADEPEAAREAFRDAIGADVDSTDGVIDAIMEGHVSDPADARERVRNRLSDLFVRRRVNFRELSRRLSSSGVPARSPMQFEQAEALHYSSLTQRAHSKNALRDPNGFRSYARTKNEHIKESVSGSAITRTAATAAVGELARQAIRRGFLS